MICEFKEGKLRRLRNDFGYLETNDENYIKYNKNILECFKKLIICPYLFTLGFQ